MDKFFRNLSKFSPILNKFNFTTVQINQSYFIRAISNCYQKCSQDDMQLTNNVHKEINKNNEQYDYTENKQTLHELYVNCANKDIHTNTDLILQQLYRIHNIIYRNSGPFKLHNLIESIFIMESLNSINKEVYDYLYHVIKDNIEKLKEDKVPRLFRVIQRLKIQRNSNIVQLLVNHTKTDLPLEETDSNLFTLIEAVITGQLPNLDAKTISGLLIFLNDFFITSPAHIKAIQKLEELLIEQMQHLTSQQIITILTRRQIRFNNKALIDSMLNHIVAEEVPFTECILIQNILNKKRYVHYRTLDYVTAKWITEPHFTQIRTMVSLLRGLGYANYKPVFWEQMQETALSKDYFNFLKNTTLRSNILNVAVNLAIQDTFNDQMLADIFANCKNKNYGWNYQILTLYQSVSTMHPSYTGPWPDLSIFEGIISFEKLYYNHPIDYYLKKALGGDQYVLTNLKSKHYHHIDHVVVIQRDGNLVNINSSRQINNFLMDLRTLIYPPESRVILIKDLLPNAYTNTGELLGFYSLQLRTLEASTGFNVVPINVMSFNEMSVEEKIPYLIQAIKLKSNVSVMD
ncbi:uncharacterized protein [Prorops nasuta]|uniref:uncharacterized protein n=1 Tax=Prorops nasuta TaxID=863751 RepID=UPI0034CF1D28